MKLIYVLYDRFLSLPLWLAEGHKMLWVLACVLTAVPIMSISCHDNSFTAAPTPPFFAVKKEAAPNYIYPDALAEGKLVLENNNLRLKPSWGKGDVWGKGYLLVWPYG